MAEEAVHPAGGDVEMADSSGKANGLPNGQTNESPIATPVSPTLPAAVSSSETAVDSHAASSPYANNTNANNDDHDHDKPPPAKRARKYSDAERASLANVSTFYPLCAVLGVLICLPLSRSEDRYSTSSLCIASAHEWSNGPGPRWSFYSLGGPTSFLPIYRPHIEAAEGRSPFHQSS